MNIYVARVPVVKAVQWFKNGDHPSDHVIHNVTSGKVIGRFIRQVEEDPICTTCQSPMSKHGVLMQGDPVLKERTITCPGDYIESVYDRKGRVLYYRIHKQKEFELIYRKALKEELIK